MLRNLRSTLQLFSVKNKISFMNFLYLFENDFLALFPEIFLLISICILLFFGLFSPTGFEHNTQNQNSLLPLFGEANKYKHHGSLALLTLFFTLCLFLNNPIQHSLIFYNTLILDDFTYFFKILLCISSFCAIVLSLDYSFQEKLNAFEFLILLLFSTLSMLLMISSYDLISFYLTIEFQSLCFYVLAASKKNSEFSTEAGLKYFLLGAFSSGLLLFGFSILYGFTGMTNFGDLSLLFTGCSYEVNNYEVNQITKYSGILLGMLFISVGFLFKLTAAPFHMWAPDVYEGSPTSITAFFSITPKIALLAVFIRLFLHTFYDFLFPFQKILLFCSAASMIVGAFAALSQQKIKRLLAYSSIGHIGYILLGLSTATGDGLEALLIYLIVYVIMTINIFGIVLSLTTPFSRLENESTNLSSNLLSNRIRYISDLRMLGKTNPILAATLTCTLFSMAGIPPLAGFCSKFYVFFSALSSSLYFFAFLGVLTSVISCFYYIRLIKIMYFEKADSANDWIVYQSMNKEISIVVGITLFFIIFFFFYPSPFFLIAHKVALSIAF